MHHILGKTKRHIEGRGCKIPAANIANEFARTRDIRVHLLARIDVH